MHIWAWLQPPGRDVDVLVLARGMNFGQMLTEPDQSGEYVIKGRAEYRAAFGKNVIDRPSVLRNRHYDFDYCGEVEGVKMAGHGSMQPMPASAPGGHV